MDKKFKKRLLEAQALFFEIRNSENLSDIEYLLSGELIGYVEDLLSHCDEKEV